MAQRQPKVRRRDFEEVDFGFTADQAMAEAKRCLQCSGCCECRVCDTACAEVGAIDHFRNSKRFEFFSPGVIVADDQEMPSGEFQNDEGVYRVGELKKDIMDLLVAGSAAAGRVMAQAKELRTSAVPELTGIQDLSGPATLGVFICTCNGTMAPAGVLERIQALAESLPGVVHADLIFSACHPRGSDRIAAAVKKHRLTRAILASCVCCPLEFECISCNDQRTRPRIHLFDRHGLDRSSFEMINIRDHLRPEVHSEDEILAKAREFLRAALIRTRFMGPLRQGITEIGKNILILGGSEIGLSCALNLDLQGFRVRLVHNGRLKGESQPADRARKRAPSIPLGQSISQVKEAVIEDIRGHIGNFTVVVREGGKRRRWRADIVCLTDENVLPLAIPEDMAGLKKFYRYDFAFFHSPQPGLYRVLPRTLDRVNAFEAGAALAAQVAGAAAEAFLKDHELSPHVDPERCRGCGRCAEICPFHAVTMVPGPHGIYTAEVLRHNCVGCGGCVGRCPVTALDVPYFSNRLLEEIVAGTWAGER
jgi:heterodisulfide reductase subunit A-like polyferredoxin